jgi:hypothetical protein
MSQQQTVLRVQTTKPSDVIVTGATELNVIYSTTGVTYSGDGTELSKYTGTTATNSGQQLIDFEIVGNGIFYYAVTVPTPGIGNGFFNAYIKKAGTDTFKLIFNTFAEYTQATFEVTNGDVIEILINNFNFVNQGNFEVYFVGDNNTTNFAVPQFDFLDLYDDIPIVINKSFAELQDIAKRNSDYSLGLKLPGSKKNNRFFEDYFNVDSQSLFFNATSKVLCSVLIDDESYFTGYMKLNKVSVLNSKVEYDVTLYSTIGDLYGSIGNNLLKDLNFEDVDYHFNHTFCQQNVIAGWRYESLKSDREVPSNYFYPVMHNGYVYNTSGNTTSVALTGVTGTSYYTTTKVGHWNNDAAAYAAGAQRYYINSPEDGVRDNQLKPAMNMYSLIQLIFKTYGYTIKSDFMSTPWMKLLYTYGYFSNDSAKLSYKVPSAQVYGLEGCEVIAEVVNTQELEYFCDVPYQKTNTSLTYWVVKKNTGIPVLCDQDIVIVLDYEDVDCHGVVTPYQKTINIPAGNTFGQIVYYSDYYVDCNYPCDTLPVFDRYIRFNTTDSNVGLSTKALAYYPLPANTVVEIVDGTYLDFSLIVDIAIKQIDVLASIAKKFNLLFIPDPDVPNQIIIESYQYYVGTGNVYDWTEKLSWDKGWSVEPAFNYVENEIIMTDLEDGDTGNTQFKNANNRIYGRAKIPNPTEFKSTTKTIETTFSPEVIRKWNPNNGPNAEFSTDVSIPLGINYTESSQEVGSGVSWIYKGVKTKPKLVFNLGNFTPFPTKIGGPTGIEVIGSTTFRFNVEKYSGGTIDTSYVNPVVSHTMPLGNPDKNKINNDSISILFNSEEPTYIQGDAVSIFNAYTNNDMYNLFYLDRVSNVFDKNTRFLTGNFYLKLSDIKNLTPKDLIKINDQYFTWNSISNYNLTNRQLTEVQLVQTNFNPMSYPTRYFKYQYCDNTGTTYNFKTQMTGTKSVWESLYYWSILYDYFCGTLGASDAVKITGYTSTFLNLAGHYTPFKIWETTKSNYEAGGTSYLLDPNKNEFIGQIENFPTELYYNHDNDIWIFNDAKTFGRINVFTDCAQFTTIAATMGITVGSST